MGFPLSAELRTDVRALAFEGDWRKADAQQLRILSAGVYQGFDSLGAHTQLERHSTWISSASPVRRAKRQVSRQLARRASAAFYWSDDTLPDSERAVFGGQNFGRGYPDDQASGDKGWGVAYEVNYSFNRDGNWVRILQPYVVVDRSRSWFKPTAGAGRQPVIDSRRAEVRRCQVLQRRPGSGEGHVR